MSWRWVSERTMEYTLGSSCSSTGLAPVEARAILSEKKYMRKLSPPAMTRAVIAPLVPPTNWPTSTNSAPRADISTRVLKLLRMGGMVGVPAPLPNSAGQPAGPTTAAAPPPASGRFARRPPAGGAGQVPDAEAGPGGPRLLMRPIVR